MIFLHKLWLWWLLTWNFIFDSDMPIWSRLSRKLAQGGGIGPIYSTLHTRGIIGPILDLSSAKWPEGAVWFNKNIVLSMFSRCRRENRGKRDNSEFCSPCPEPLFFWFWTQKHRKTENFIFKKLISSSSAIFLSIELLRSPIGSLVPRVCRVTSNNPPLSLVSR